MKKIDTYFILNTGASMPAVGLGTWKFPLDKAEKAVFCALSECGYRHIDCAAIYRNEKEIGQSLKKVFVAPLSPLRVYSINFFTL